MRAPPRGLPVLTRYATVTVAAAFAALGTIGLWVGEWVNGGSYLVASGLLLRTALSVGESPTR